MPLPPNLYLDFDGVVMTTRANVGHRRMDDPIAFGILRRIVVATGARIVVSSTMRICQSDDCLRLLEEYGLKEHLHEDTFTGNVDSRSAEIEAHLAAHGRPAYIIIDDERNDFTPEQLKRLVHTDMQFGLGAFDYGRALRLLQHPDGDYLEQDREPYQTPRLTLSNHARAALAAAEERQ